MTNATIEMDKLFDVDGFARHGFKTIRNGGNPGDPGRDRLVEHDGYIIERDGRRLSVSYGWAAAEGAASPVWQLLADNGEIAYADGTRPLDVQWLSENFGLLAAGDENVFETAIERATK